MVRAAAALFTGMATFEGCRRKRPELAPMRMPKEFTLFLVATQFLTRLPVPRLPDFEPIWLTRSARYFPLVGALVGTLNVSVWWVCRHWFAPSIAVGLMLAASSLITGAFHEDGFADACDGFGGGSTPERVLAIMKDSRIGAYGAMGVSLLLGLKWATLVGLPDAALPWAVIAAHVTSRWWAIGLIWRLDYVREDDGSKAKPLAQSLSGPEWLASGLIGAMGLLAATLVLRLVTASLDLAVSLAAALAAGVTVYIAGGYFRRRIGGYTGDCLGAAQQLAELVFLLLSVGAIAPSHAFGWALP
jgi:adenosylcobinamide-GDP ribazoletransferase